MQATVPQLRFNEAEVRRALEMLAPGVFEMRALNAMVDGDRRGATFSGYYDDDHHDEVIHDLQRISAATAVYFTPNPVKPELLARAFNRARRIVDRTPTTSDADILERHWLLIDIDSVRPAGISATEEERENAYRIVIDVDQYLHEHGFPPGFICDSGNGCHLMIPFQSKNDDAGLLFHKQLLADLAKRFNEPTAHVDLTTCNASRIWKLPGTLVCKGDNCPEIGREWRIAKILRRCDGHYAPIPVGLAATALGFDAEEEKSAPPAPPAHHSNGHANGFDVEDWLRRHSVPVKSTESYQGGTKFVLECCPFNPEHKGKDAAVFRKPSGSLGFRCLHNSCSGNGWREFRQHFEPLAYEPKQNSERGWKADRGETARPPEEITFESITPAALE